MDSVTFDSVALDMELPEVVNYVDQRVITPNAAASLDYNPIHVNPDWAKEVNLLGRGTTIAHGMCTFSFMTTVVTNWSYSSGGFISRLESKFIEPVRPGDTITSRAVVTEKHPRLKGKSFVVLDFWAENQTGKKVAVGVAHVMLS